MSEQSGPAGRGVPKALRRAMKVFSSQALALDRIFSRTVKEAAPGSMRYHEDMRMALKAQAQYRATLKILMALEGERHADLSSEARRAKEEEKSRNSNERTNGQPESHA